MDYAIPTGLVLVTGVVLAILAQRRGWNPSLAVALSVGLAVRVLIMLLSAADHWQPIDYVNSFRPAGEAILNGGNPVNSGWHFLPTIPYVYGLLLWLGIPWEIAGRLVTVVADLILIPLVGRLAGGAKANLRAFQYACNPLAILVASVHGQVEPVSLVFAVAAYVVARGPGEWTRGEPLLDRPSRMWRSFVTDRLATRRAFYAGLLMGLGLCAKSWPAILIPGLLMFLPGVRSRIVAMVGVAVPPVLFLLTMPLGGWVRWDQLAEVLKTISLRPSDVRPITGDWGWTAVSSGGEWDLSSWKLKVGQYLIYAVAAFCLYWWRKADPIDVTIAILLGFMIVTPRLGAQYLLWFMPFLVARPTRFAWPAIIGCSLWAATGYLVLTQFCCEQWGALHAPWAVSSVLVFPLIIAAMPWNRRDAAPVEPVVSPQLSMSRTK
ncbi:hypothetical protein GCM10009555_099900 [Acrocarpospora macrocephala]|uniref:DUF2029 domain-containing protein n=1 Tax=Acrocarpospora macrocephala TaxID=150177 RepID=A0A5M3X0D3_9ACTN|nr:hypothetical protein [Acrocarpospora macrocephala]GES15215.1 hypothetical protein Amac_088120 [Acrocarpospora macrocephala]